MWRISSQRSLSHHASAWQGSKKAYMSTLESMARQIESDHKTLKLYDKMFEILPDVERKSFFSALDMKKWFKIKVLNCKSCLRLMKI